MQPTDPGALAFDDLVIDFAGRRLLRDGRALALEPKAFAVLALLAGAPGRVFTRDEILDAVWGHRHVTQSVLNRIMSLLRQALGEDAQAPRRLHTVYGVGYRFDLPAAARAVLPPAAPEVGAAAMPEPPPPTRWTHRLRPWLAAALVLVVIAGVVAGRWQPPQAAVDGAGEASVAAAPAAMPSLAVLPFADLSRSRDQGYLAEGLAEDIRTQLAQARGLRVLGRASSARFGATPGDPRAVARQLGVAHLLEGSVRGDGRHLRVSVQLLRAGDGTQLWSKAYTRPLRDVIAMQEEVARDVALALSIRLDAAVFSRRQGGTADVEAYVRYLRWRDIVMREQFDVDHDRERLRLAREMVALDPSCALCWDALAGSLASMAQELGGPQAERLRAESTQARARIADLAPDSWLARRDRANALWRGGRRAEAMELARQVAQAGPLSKERAWDYAYMLYAMGHLDDTIALVEQVRAVEPMALFLSRDLQYDYSAARRFADAEAEYLRGQSLEGSQLDPDHLAFFRQLAGKRPGGLAQLRSLHARLLRHEEFDTPFFRDFGAALGDRARLLGLVRRALGDSAYGGGRQSAHVWTLAADALGDAELALAGLRQDLAAQPGFAQGTMAPSSYVALWNAPYSGLRAHPGFKALLVQAGVVDYWRQTGRWGDGCEPVGATDFRCR